MAFEAAARVKVAMHRSIVLACSALVFRVSDALQPSDQTTSPPDERQPSVLQVVSVRDDNLAAVPSMIFRISPKGETSFLMNTDASGIAKLRSRCRSSDRFRAEPHNARFVAGGLTCLPTADTLAIKVSPKLRIRQLSRYGSQLSADNQFADAALVYNEVAGRIAFEDPAASDSARIKSIKLFAHIIAVPQARALDTVNGSVVMSPEFQKALVKYQAKEAVTVSGQLDYATLRSASLKPIVHYLFVAPPSRPSK
jgi:hypothetical protein